jgi:hypothetical protein
MSNLNDIYFENDKTNAPLLLAASFNGLVTFLGSFAQNKIIYWKFTPTKKALELIEQYKTKTEPRIPAQDLFDAIEYFWQKVSLIRNGETKHGTTGD